MIVDHLQQALRRLRPRFRHDPPMLAILDVLMAQVQHLDNLAVEMLVMYTLNHSRTPLAVLDQIGALLEFPRNPAWSKALYRVLLRARIRARKSRGTFEDVLAVANLMRGPNVVDSAQVTILRPEALQITIPGPPEGMEDRARAILTSAIQETTLLDVYFVPDSPNGAGDYLKLGSNGPGLDSKLL